MAYSEHFGCTPPLKAGRLRVIHVDLGPSHYERDYLEMQASCMSAHALACMPLKLAKSQNKFVYISNIDSSSSSFQQENNMLFFTVLEGSSKITVCWIVCPVGAPFPAKEIVTITKQNCNLILFLSHPNINEEGMANQIAHLLLMSGMIMVQEEHPFNKKRPLDCFAVSRSLMEKTKIHTYGEDDGVNPAAYIIADVDCDVPIKAPCIIEELTEDSYTTSDSDDDLQNDLQNDFFLALFWGMCGLGEELTGDRKSSMSPVKKKKKRKRKKTVKKPTSLDMKDAEKSSGDCKSERVETKGKKVNAADGESVKIKNDSAFSKKEENAASGGSAEASTKANKKSTSQSSYVNGTTDPVVGSIGDIDEIDNKPRRKIYVKVQSNPEINGVSFTKEEESVIMDLFRQRVGPALGLLLEKRWDAYEKWRSNKTDINWQHFKKTVDDVRSVMKIKDQYQLPGIDASEKY